MSRGTWACRWLRVTVPGAWAQRRAPVQQRRGGFHGAGNAVHAFHVGSEPAQQGRIKPGRDGLEPRQVLRRLRVVAEFPRTRHGHGASKRIAAAGRQGAFRHTQRLVQLAAGKVHQRQPRHERGGRQAHGVPHDR